MLFLLLLRLQLRFEGVAIEEGRSRFFYFIRSICFGFCSLDLFNNVEA